MVPAYRTVGVLADPDRINLDDLAAHLVRIEPEESHQQQGHLIRIPVCYDGEDLSEVADRLGLIVDKLIALHSSSDYRVFALGFQPGFPYSGYLPAALSGLPRRSKRAGAGGRGGHRGPTDSSLPSGDARRLALDRTHALDDRGHGRGLLPDPRR